MPTAQEVLEYWFGPLEGPTDFNPEKASMWWTADNAIDREIRERFFALWEQAKAGKLDTWLESPRSALALIILLDQFSRNLGRGTPDAFASDTAALHACNRSIQLGYDRELRPIECSFLYMPLMHCESRKTARQSLVTFERLSERIRTTCPPNHPDPLPHAKEHTEIIERFGRYPHRNELLARQSTPEELEFLASGGLDYGQKKI